MTWLTLKARLGSVYAFTVPTTVVGLGVLVHACLHLPDSSQQVGWLLLAGLALLGTSFSLKMPGVAAHLSISDTFFLATALLYGPAPATVAIAADTLLMSARRGHGLHQLLFNTASNALGMWCSAQAYVWLTGGGAAAGEVTPHGMVLPLAVMATVYFLLNTAFPCAAVARSKQIAAWQLWRRHFSGYWINYCASGSVAFTLIILSREVGVFGMAAILPVVYLFHQSVRASIGRLDDAERHVTKLNALYMSTVTAFATAIEAKDGVTSSHIHRVQAYSMALARAVGITDDAALQALQAAALLHDTGKLAVPERILNKPGKLTAQEFETMKLHVEVGAGILSAIDFPFPVVPIVRAHHESWDGSGYPNGLRGADIPLGARILSVVDCYDALTSDRPYRRALSDEDAVQCVVDRAGTMYDPDVVEAFVRMDRKLAAMTSPQPDLMRALLCISDAQTSPEQPSQGRAPELRPGLWPGPPQLEIAALRTVTALLATPSPRWHDPAPLLFAILQSVAPGCEVVIYRTSEDNDCLSAMCMSDRARAGLDGEPMRVGERLSGWVVANGQSMVNGNTELDSPQLASLGLSHATSISLTHHGALVGALTVYSGPPLADDCARRLERLAPLLSSMLAVPAGGNFRSHPSSLRIVAHG